MIKVKYNLIRADRAKELTTIEYPKRLYLDYMRELNESIVKHSEDKGYSGMIYFAPEDIIADKVYKELEDAGYVVEKIREKEIRISWN